MHSEIFKKVKAYYDNGLWDIKRVRNAVIKGRITADEFEEITGMAYEEKENELEYRI